MAPSVADTPRSTDFLPATQESNPPTAASTADLWPFGLSCLPMIYTLSCGDIFCVDARSATATT